MTRGADEPVRTTVVVAITASGFDLAAAVERAREQGCMAVELAGEVAQTAEQWQTIRAGLSSNHVNCAGVALNSSGIELGTRDVKVRAMARERVNVAIRDASMVGASYVRFVAARLDAMDGQRPRHEDTHHHALDALLALRHEAGLFGIRLVVEVGAHGFLSSPSEARTFLDAVNSPWIGASLNLATCESDLAAADWIETLTHRLAMIRMEAPDAGGMDWAAVGRALAAERYDGFILTPLNKLINNDK